MADFDKLIERQTDTLLDLSEALVAYREILEYAKYFVAELDPEASFAAELLEQLETEIIRVKDFFIDKENSISLSRFKIWRETMPSEYSTLERKVSDSFDTLIFRDSEYHSAVRETKSFAKIHDIAFFY